MGGCYGGEEFVGVGDGGCGWGEGEGAEEEVWGGVGWAKMRGGLRVCWICLRLRVFIGGSCRVWVLRC